MQILNARQEDILSRERIVLKDILKILEDFGVGEADRRTLLQSIQQMDDLFLLVIVGEFNAGKSSVINALLGEKVLAEGVTPTTTHIQIIRYGAAQSQNVIDNQIHLLTYPAQLLSEISIVDTPGTNAIIREHEVLTNQFVPRSDLVLFITSADRPFTESERSFMEKVRQWGKKVIILINKIDILENSDDLTNIIDFVEANSRKLLGVKPEIFPVSARKALKAKTGNPDLWEESRFGALENHIQTVLDQGEHLRLKFLNPLGVGKNLIRQYLTNTEKRLKVLAEDQETLDFIATDLADYDQKMHRDFKFRMADVDNSLLEMERRGQEYFDDTMRLIRLPDLVNKEKIQKQFQETVVGDVPREIELKVNGLIDWIVEKDFKAWESVMQLLADRKEQFEQYTGSKSPIGGFQYDRMRLMQTIEQEVQVVISSYDKVREAKVIANHAQEAVAATAALEIGALGIGALVAMMSTAMAMDATGIILGSSFAILGLFIIPAKKRRATQELSEKVGELREKLTLTLEKQFTFELGESLNRIQLSLDPYGKFVREEAEKLNLYKQHLTTLEQQILELEGLIAESFSGDSEE